MIYYVNVNDSDNSVWVTSDDNQNGTELCFSKDIPEEKRILIAVAEFLGFDPESNLSFDDDVVEPESGRKCRMSDCCSMIPEG